MSDKTPLELAFVEAERHRLAAEGLEEKSRTQKDPEWQLYYAKEAETERALETYNLDQAREYAAIFIKAEPTDADA